MSIEKLHQIVVNLGKATKFGGVFLDIKNVTKDIHMNFWPGNKREIKHTALRIVRIITYGFRPCSSFERYDFSAM